MLQSYEVARFLSSHRRPDFLTLLCGDLNSPPYDLCIQLIQAVSFGQAEGCVPRLIDCFRACHPHSFGFTSAANDNTFTFSTEPLQRERRGEDHRPQRRVRQGRDRRESLETRESSSSSSRQ